MADDDVARCNMMLMLITIALLIKSFNINFCPYLSALIANSVAIAVADSKIHSLLMAGPKQQHVYPFVLGLYWGMDPFSLANVVKICEHTVACRFNLF